MYRHLPSYLYFLLEKVCHNQCVKTPGQVIYYLNVFINYFSISHGMTNSYVPSCTTYGGVKR